MGYHLNRLDESVFIAVSKLVLTKFGVHQRLESCGFTLLTVADNCLITIFVLKMFCSIRTRKSTYWHFSDLSRIINQYPFVLS